MAAVQATPAMQQQQQGNANTIAMNNVLPQGMTKEDVQQIYKVCSHRVLPIYWHS